MAIDMNDLTATFKALSDRNRLRIVSALMNYDELCACQLTELIQVTGATASRHMGLLLACGLVESRKDGRWVHYRLRRERADLAALISWIAGQLRDDPDAARDAESMRAIARMDREDLCRRQRGETCCPQTCT